MGPGGGGGGVGLAEQAVRVDLAKQLGWVSLAGRV